MRNLRLVDVHLQALQGFSWGRDVAVWSDDGDAAQLIERCTKRLAMEPRNTRALALRGGAHTQRGEHALAVRDDIIRVLSSAARRALARDAHARHSIELRQLYMYMCVRVSTSTCT